MIGVGIDISKDKSTVAEIYVSVVNVYLMEGYGYIELKKI